MSRALNKDVRNVAIIVLIAAAIYAVPRGDFALGFLTQLISLLFLAALAWIGVRLYREHRMDLESLGTRNRLLLYSAAGVVALTLSATNRLWNSGLGTILWLALLSACAYAGFIVYRAAREY
jgi:hypothetical protein